MQKTHRFTLFVLLYLGIGTVGLQAQTRFFVRDLWTEQPLENVRIITGSDTIHSASNGFFRLPPETGRTDSLQFRHDKYFDLTIDLQKHVGPFVYLTPLESTALITVVQPRTADSPLMLPAHATRIEIDDEERFRHATVDALLSGQNSILLKSFGGPGQIQSISVRGMAPEQTQILFDGVPVNSLQLGSAQLGHYNLQQLGALEIYRGGNSLFGGSGAIGGTIDLHPAGLKPEFGYSATHGISSFGNRALGFSLNVPADRFRQRVSLNLAKGANNYKTNYRNQDVKLQNRDFKHQQISYENDFHIAPEIRLSGYAGNFRNETGSSSPFFGPLAEESNRARMTNDNTLAKIKLNYDAPGAGVLFQTYVRNEWMEYRNPLLKINSKPLHSIHFNQERGVQLRGRYLIGRGLLIHTGTEGAWQKIRSTEAGSHGRHRLAAYFLSDYYRDADFALLKSFRISASARLEKFSDFGAVFLPGASVSLQGASWQWFIAAGKNYRAPTFNELYWQPGGNPELSPENAWNSETGFEFGRPVADRVQIELNLYGYLNKVHDQIKWLPVGAYWAPQNISEVLSRGVEFELAFSDLGERHRFGFNYTYSKATREKAEFIGDRTKGNQLPYLPFEQWNLYAKTTIRFSQFGVDFSRMGYRYLSIQNDPGAILPSHQIVNIWVAVQARVVGHKINVTGKIDNLLSEKYAVMDGYPMPPRSYSILFSIGY